MIRRPPRSTRVSSSAASDVYKRQPSPSLSLSPLLFLRSHLINSEYWNAVSTNLVDTQPHQNSGNVLLRPRNANDPLQLRQAWSLSGWWFPIFRFQRGRIEVTCAVRRGMYLSVKASPLLTSGLKVKEAQQFLGLLGLARCWAEHEIYCQEGLDERQIQIRLAFHAVKDLYAFRILNWLDAALSVHA